MHKKNTQLRSKLISIAGILAVLVGGLVAQSVRAVNSNPTPVCVGASCTVTFEANGDYYLWTPPIGAKNISFDLMGAQGGRSGGLGGRVTGNLTSVPSSLYIYVGGAGAQGSGAAGGFNGGGNAGGGRGDEGSGGGATDIRSTTSINDRIAVAGGGGGSGGFSGGTGGNAGGLNASAGTSGQGQGGSGATQSSGGNGGYPNGGSWGSTGDFGVGGVGGSSYVSGGGGGGGGFYGGGGGGADIDTCCSNAGGGGGGSSWSHSVQTSSVSHTGGYRSGAGLAILTYAMPPSVTTFAASNTLTNATSLSYNLVFNEAVTGLSNSDFAMTGSTATCTMVSITGSATTYAVTVSGCGVGTLKLTLLSNSVSGALAGPAQEKTAADVVIERIAPQVTVTAPSSPNAATTLQYALTFSEPITGLEVADFSLQGAGCQLGNIAGSESNYSLQITNCTDTASVQISLTANSVSDLAGNVGPVVSSVATAVLIDRTAPVGVWAAPATTSYLSPGFEINFTESVTGISASDFLMIGAASNCTVSVTEATAGLKFLVETTGCSDGTVQMLMNTNSYSDALGNTGPATVSASAVTTKVAQPASTPTPTPAQIASPAPTVSAAPPAAAAPAEPPATASPSAPAPPAEPAVPVDVLAEAETYEESTLAPVATTYAFTPSLEEDLEPVAQSRPFDSENEPQITIHNPTAAKPFVVSNNQWVSYAAMAFGALAISFAAVGAIKGMRLMRTRRLVRKFS